MTSENRVALIARLCAVAALTLAVQERSASAADADWLTDDGQVLELKLAHLDKERPDGGILRIDRRKRLVVWEGILGDVGCKIKVEATFDDVKAAEIDDRQPGFVLEMRKGKPKKLILIPVPHAAALVLQPRVVDGGMKTALENAPGLRGPDGGSMSASGGAAGAGPSTKKLELPAEVVADVRKAVSAIQQALDRAQP